MTINKPIDKVVEKKFRDYPEKILQFGTGNFLRGFADWMIEKANRDGVFEGTVVMCRATNSRREDKFKKQKSMYTVVVRGIENGKKHEQYDVISSISRTVNPYEEYSDYALIAKNPELEIIISNTTEAGIVYDAADKFENTPPETFPGKLCKFLFERFTHFSGDPERGLLILPTELIDNNGKVLRSIILHYADDWGLHEEFKQWVSDHCFFSNTMVDRIVTGYPKNDVDEITKKIGYSDELMVACELYNLWVIEGEKRWVDKFPIHKTDANVIWTDNVIPYKQLKVRILNGSHSAVIPGAYLAGYDTVSDFFSNTPFSIYEKKLIKNEILPAIDMPEDEVNSFAHDVMNRFSNPFITHYLYDITLNNASKYKARCIPTIKDYYEKYGRVPEYFGISLAFFIRFYKIVYKDGAYVGERENGEEYLIRDDEAVLSYFADLWKNSKIETVVETALGDGTLWGGFDLGTVDRLSETVIGILKSFENMGIQNTVSNFLDDHQEDPSL